MRGGAGEVGERLVAVPLVVCAAERVDQAAALVIPPAGVLAVPLLWFLRLFLPLCL